MRMTTWVGGALLAAGLFSVGCGTEMDMEEPSAMEPIGTEPISSELAEPATHEAENVVWCSNKVWRVNFYAEPELINVIGYYQCPCYGQQVRVGSTSNYTKLVYEFYCSLE